MPRSIIRTMERYANLDQAVHAEQRRPAPSELRLLRLKRLQLTIRERLGQGSGDRYERSTQIGSGDSS